MNVLFYYYFLGLGGVEASLLNRLAALKRYGIEGQYWFSIFYGDGAKYIGKKDCIRQLDIHAHSFIEEVRKFDAIVVVDLPDLVIALEQNHVNLPVIFESHASFPPALERYYGVLDREIIRAVVVPSTYNLRLIKSSNKYRKDPIVIPNCIDPSMINGSLKLPASFLMEIPNRPVVIWVGRLEDEKNPLEFLRIVKSLETRRPDIRFILIGDTPDYHLYLDSLRASLGTEIPDSVKFIQKVKFEEMASYYLLASKTNGLLLSTSNYESAPMTFIEAMASHCPILSSDVGGVGDLLQAGKLGFMYKCGDVELAANIVDEMTSARYSEVKKQMTEAAFDCVVSVHSPEAVAKKYAVLMKDTVYSLM